MSIKLRAKAPAKIPETAYTRPNFPPYSREGIIKPSTAAASITPDAKDNTIAENYLFSELDYLNTYLNIYPESREYLNQLDRVVVAYNLYQRSKGYEELMKQAEAQQKQTKR